jgi:hypothetical protein
VSTDGKRRSAVAEGVSLALFKVVATADLAGAERAVEWARTALEDEELLAGVVEAARARHVDGDAGERRPPALAS